MKNIDKAIKAIFAVPAIFFGLFIISDLLPQKILGVRSFTQELFFTLIGLYFLAVPFVLVFIIKKKRGRIFFFVLGFAYAYILIGVQKSPQIDIVRFYYQTKNHNLLSSLRTEDVSFIALDNVIFEQPEQIHPIVAALNESTWYSPNHERRGNEVPMKIVLRNGQEMYFHLSRFYGEDSGDILFIRPYTSGFWADGNAYVPTLPSILENLGYTLPSTE